MQKNESVTHWFLCDFSYYILDKREKKMYNKFN